MKTLFIIILTLFVSKYSFGQEAVVVDTTAINFSDETMDDYIINEKRKMVLESFVIVTIVHNEAIYSVKIINEDPFGKKIWLEKTYPYKQVKNKNGKWVEKKKEGKELTKINLSCSNEMYEFLEVYIYDGKGSAVYSAKGNGEEHSIIPDSVMNEVSKIVCF